MQCVILAGGLGTRMKPVTEKVPKSLLPVLGEPFAHHQLKLLASTGITDVVFSIGYKGEMLRDYVGTGEKWGLRVTYVDEGPNLMGTAGALRLAFDQGALDEKFFVLYGDSYLPIDFKPVWERFEKSSESALMTVLKNQGRWDVSNADYHDGLVSYQKKDVPPSWSYIDYGLSVLTAQGVRKGIPPKIKSDLADFFRQLSLAKELAGFEVTERFYEIGSPCGLSELENYLSICYR